MHEIISDTYYDYYTADEHILASANDLTNTINVYFVNSILFPRGTGAAGYTYLPPGPDRIFMTHGGISGLTLEHEMGHYFSLFHTHGTTNFGTTDELVDGSNCTTAGDRICDTPADPNLSGKVNSSCLYIGTDRDANGQLYVPDPTNIMSYSHCDDRFSTGQYVRAREGFERSRNYLISQFSLLSLCPGKEATGVASIRC